MSRTIITLLVCALFSFATFSQDSIVLQGHYNGKNLYVINPTVVVGKDSSFCVRKVTVNNQVTKDEIRSNSFQIDFSQLNLQYGAAVKVCISCGKACMPKVVNSEVLQTKSNFAFITAKVDKTSKLTWTVKGDLYSSFTVEQFRWNKWMTIGEVDNMDTIRKNAYIFELKLHFGMNQFRISHTDEKGILFTPKSLNIRRHPL